MKSLTDLINLEEPGINLVRTWLSEGSLQYEILPPSSNNEALLIEAQVSTRSPMGAIIYETGGVLIDHGWLRILGSSSERMQRSLPEWNQDVLGEDRSAYLIADDVLGGFFALNGGAFGEDLGSVYYLPYDDLEWFPLEINYSEFIAWSVTNKLHDFYGSDRFNDWIDRSASITSDQCFCFYPFLWTEEGSIKGSDCKPVSAFETINLKLNL